MFQIFFGIFFFAFYGLVKRRPAPCLLPQGPPRLLSDLCLYRRRNNMLVCIWTARSVNLVVNRRYLAVCNTGRLASSEKPVTVCNRS